MKNIKITINSIEEAEKYKDRKYIQDSFCSNKLTEDKYFRIILNGKTVVEFSTHIMAVHYEDSEIDKEIASEYKDKYIPVLEKSLFLWGKFSSERSVLNWKKRLDELKNSDDVSFWIENGKQWDDFPNDCDITSV